MQDEEGGGTDEGDKEDGDDEGDKEVDFFSLLSWWNLSFLKRVKKPIADCCSLLKLSLCRIFCKLISDIDDMRDFSGKTSSLCLTSCSQDARKRDIRFSIRLDILMTLFF